MKNSHFAIGFLTVVSLSNLTAGCGSPPVKVVQPQEAHDDDTTAIQAASKAWSDADLAKDLPKCLSFYADDAERMVPGSFVISGKEDLRRAWEKHLAANKSFSWTTAKIEVAGSSDVAYETGVYQSKTVNEKKQPVTTTGKYVFVWKKQDDGKWKVVEDISNPDQ